MSMGLIEGEEEDGYSRKRPESFAVNAKSLEAAGNLKKPPVHIPANNGIKRQRSIVYTLCINDSGSKPLPLKHAILQR